VRSHFIIQGKSPKEPEEIFLFFVFIAQTLSFLLCLKSIFLSSPISLQSARSSPAAIGGRRALTLSALHSPSLSAFYALGSPKNRIATTPRLALGLKQSIPGGSPIWIPRWFAGATRAVLYSSDESGGNLANSTN
jgi:hypothetical protein